MHFRQFLTFLSQICQKFSKSKFWVLVGKIFFCLKMSKMHKKLKKKFLTLKFFLTPVTLTLTR